MRKTLIVSLLAVAVPATADDRFNCPKPKGDLSVDSERIMTAWPTHIDRVLPEIVDIDFRCRIDAEGRFVDCIFSARQDLTEAQKSVVQRTMPRVMRGLKTDYPNQPCVADKLTFKTGDAARSSIPSPDEAAAEGEVPDRSDQDPA